MGAELTIEKLTERKFTKSGLSYILKAESKTIDIKKLKKINLFNRKKIISNAIYYTNGAFVKKNIKVNFAKGFFLEGDFYMQDCYSSSKDNYIKSKTAKYDGKKIIFYKVIMQKNKKTYHKFKYIVDTK